jgi:putative transcriptional regulator
LQVNDEIALTTSRDVLTAIAHGEGPAHYLIALGYAGWGPGQLEQELSDNAWLSCPVDKRILFELPDEERWDAAAALLGVDLNLLSSDIGHA